MTELTSLQEKLEYTFHNEELLRRALYHSSYANEHKNQGIHSNERIEFLGDAVLGLVSADFLYATHPELPEGELTRLRAALVCEKSLFEVAQSIHLGQYLYLSRGEEMGGGRTRPSILADATECVFAAVYMDGGMEPARKLIHRLLLEKEHEAAIAARRRDNKTDLQELVQKKADQILQYELVSESGPEHQKEFTFCVRLNGTVVGSGTGRSKKEAEQAAAQAALELLRQGEKE